MRRSEIARVASRLVLAAFGVVIAGCEKSSRESSPLNVSGAWTIVGVGLPTLAAELAHSGTSVTGTVSDDADYARSISGTTGQPMGATTGSRRITLVVTYSDGMIATYGGEVSDDGSRMSGMYDTNWGTGDAWSATRR
jgi:hypothetical protein